jgi:glycosyltransferase involved in cell wall biosynthesis
MNTYRLGIFVSHPIQYQVPLYRCLEKSNELEVSVIFLTDHGVKKTYDPEFGISIQYDIPLLEGYNYKLLRNISPVPSPSSPFGAINPNLITNISSSSFDVVLFHGWSNVSLMAGISIATSKRIPFMIRGDTRPDNAGMSHRKRRLKHLILEPIIGRASACLAIGRLNQQFYLDYGAKPSQIFSAPYSVETDRFEEFGAMGRESKHHFLKSLNLDSETPTVLFAAKLQPWKRPLDLVYAIDNMVHKPNLIFIGNGPLMTQLKSLSSSRPWIRLLGFINQSEIAKWYGVADILVLPSIHEQWGLTVNEAMSAGCIPIVSDSVGCKDDLVTEEYGEVFQTGNINELASAIENAISKRMTDEQRKRCVEKSREYGIGATAKGIKTAVNWIMESK